MSESDLKAQSIHIEPYAGGFMIADYSNRTPSRFGARYCGQSFDWRDQPICDDPFPTKEEAIRAAQKCAEPPR